VNAPCRSVGEPRPAGQVRAMTLRAVARSVRGTLRQDVEIDGRHHLITDEPERLGGDGSAPSPHELLPVALGACISTHLVMYVRTKGWELGDVPVDVDYDHKSVPRRFHVEIRFGAELTPSQLGRLPKVATSCPVRRAPERRGIHRTDRGTAGPPPEGSVRRRGSCGRACGVRRCRRGSCRASA
jgi:putative redox protein